MFVKQSSFDCVPVVLAASLAMFWTETCLAGFVSVTVSVGSGPGETKTATAVGDDPSVSEAVAATFSNPVADGGVTSTAFAGRGFLRVAVVAGASAQPFAVSVIGGDSEATYSGAFVPRARDSNGDLLPGNISIQAILMFSGTVEVSNSGMPPFSESGASIGVTAFGTTASFARSTITGTSGTPPENIFVEQIVPNGEALLVSMSMSATAAILVDGPGTGIARAEFGDSLFWGGITNVQHTGGLEVASFTALGEGIDWVMPVPEPSTLTLALCGLIGLLPFVRRRRA